MSRVKRPIVATILAIVLSATSFSPAAYAVDDAFGNRPREMAMGADLLLARPALLVGTVLGTVAWGVGLPFSLLGGNVGESTEVLVLTPARNTFVRCLGCTPAQHQQMKDEKEVAKKAK